MIGWLRPAATPAVVAAFGLTLALTLGACGLAEPRSSEPAPVSRAAVPISEDDLTELAAALDAAVALESEVGSDMAGDATQ